MHYRLGQDIAGQFVETDKTKLTVRIAHGDRRLMLLTTSGRDEVFVALRGWRPENWLTVPSPFHDQVEVEHFKGAVSRPSTVVTIVRREKGVLVFDDIDPYNDCNGHIEIPGELEKPLLKVMVGLGLHIPLLPGLSLDNTCNDSLATSLLKPR